jgi:hypothetical protein
MSKTKKTSSKTQKPSQPWVFSQDSSTRYFDKTTPQAEILSGTAPSWMSSATSSGYRLKEDGTIVAPHLVDVDVSKFNKWSAHPTAAVGSSYRDGEDSGTVTSGSRAREIENREAEEYLHLFATAVAKKNRSRHESGHDS